MPFSAQTEAEGGCFTATYVTVAIWDAIKGAWVTFPGRDRYKEGLPDVRRLYPLLIPQGLLFFGICYVPFALYQQVYV